jgi:hypothetical protein
MDDNLRTAVRERAQERCEYCLLSEEHAPVTPFQVEHIVAKQHGGGDELSNLALACHRCNLAKGPNLGGIDPKTRKKVWLFNSRRHKWARHFRWVGPVVVGRTLVGRATVAVLQMNDDERVELRRNLIKEGVFPPT